MTGLVFKNNAKTTLSSAVNNSTTTIPVTEGSVFPACNLGSSGTFFFVTLDDDTNNEIVKVTVSSGSSGNQNLTVVRAQEGTSATAFDSGDKVELRMTAGMVDTFNLSGSDISLDSSNNRMGFGDTTPEVSLDLGSQTDSLHVPVGTTAQRPGSPEAGYLRYNSTTGKFEGYTNAWGDLADGSDFLVTNTFTTANASTTAFTISNAVQDEKQLLVFIEGVFQAHNSYSVSGTTVTLNTAPASGREVTIYSALSNLQGANMVKATMTGDNSDTTLDLGVTPVSENNVQVYFDGVYQNKDSFSISGQTLTFGVAPPTGVAVEAITHTILDVSAAASSVLIDEFTGDGSDTTFTLSAAPANENNTQVYVGGVYQEKATYSVSGTTLTFSEAPANGVSIEVMSIAVGQINSAIQLSDADGDTKVMVEESADEDKIRFDTGGTERAIINSTGLGIGTTTPSQILNVEATSTPVIEVSTLDDNNPASASAIDLVEKQPTHASNTATFGQAGVYGYRIQLNGSDNTLRIKSGAQTTVTDRVVIDRDTNNIGLGTTSLTKDTGYATLSLSDTTGGQVVFKDDGTNIAGILGNNTNMSLTTVGSRYINFNTNGSERMRINSSGQVMIGTTDAGYPDYGDSLTLGDVDGGGGNAGMTIRSGTSSYGTLYFSDDTGTALGTYAGKLQYYHSDNSMALNTSSYERMRIDSSGNLLINTTTRKNTGSRVSIKPVGSGVAFETQPSDSNGYYVALFYNNSSSLVGSIYTSPSSTSFNTSSDYRLKENVSYEFDALSRVTQLKPARFNFIADADITVDGFLAHEVSDIVPEAVTGEKDGEEMQGIDQSKLVPLLTKAIQELSAKVEELEGKIN